MTAILSSPSYYLPPLIGVTVVLVLIVIALVWSRRDFTVGLFSGFLVSIALHNLLIFGMRSSPDVYHALLWERAMCVPALATFILYYHFTLVYTSNRGQRRVLLASYLLLIVAGALAPTDLVIQGMRVEEYGYAPIVGPISYPWFAVGPLLVLGGAYNLLRYYKVSTMSEERKRAIILAVAAVFPLTGLVLDGFTNLPPVFIWGNLMFSILCTVAILKYHLLDIRVAVRKSLVYLLVSVGVAIPYVGALLFVNQIFKTAVEPWWMHALIILLLAILLRPLYSWAQNLVDRMFYRDRYDYLRALERFSREAQSIVNLKELGSRMVRLVGGALRTSSVCLLLPSNRDDGFAVASSLGLDNSPSGAVIRSRSHLVKWLERQGRVLSSKELSVIPELQSLANTEAQNLENLRAELFVPIRARGGQLFGILILGEKRGQQPYSDEDRQLLSTLSGQMAINLENARLYEEARGSEKVLRQSEREYRELAESISDVFFAMDKELRCTYWNTASEEFTGISAKDALGKHLYDLFPHSEVTRRAEKVYQKVLKTKQAEQFVNEYQLGGKDFLLEINAYPSSDGLSIFAKDITERKRVEEREKQLQQEISLSRRLASIGELAAGIAHEINNPLTGILGFSQRLLRKSTDELTKRDLKRIYEEASRVARVVENLGAFARPNKPKKEYLGVNEVLQKALEMRIYELKTSNIEVVVEFASSLPSVMADFHQIQQLFLNIIMNAEQAMSEANRWGKLVIKTNEQNGYIRIAFTDDGPGISDENLAKLFDPFFTTRGDKGGTGLGLSICHGIVTEHRGKIYAKSKLGRGTTFFVELPLNIEQRDDNKVVEAKSTGRSE